MLGEVTPMTSDAGSMPGAGGALIGGDSAVPWTDGSNGSSCADPIRMVTQGLDPVFYLIVDRSRLMQNDPQQQQNGRWSDLSNGLDNYFDTNAAAALRWGMAYYPFPCQLRSPQRDCPMGGLTCDVGANAEAFPDIGQVRNAQNSLGMVSPPGNGAPVMRPALEGAFQHIRTWEQSHRNNFVIPVIIAGGAPDPTSCDPDDVPAVQDVALDSNSKTFVIAFETNGAPLDPIANSGGTGTAIEIDDRQNGPSIASQLSDTFESILDDSNRPCVFELPQSPLFQPSEINIVLRTQDPMYLNPLFSVDDRRHCGGTGAGAPLQWYYDDATNPTHIIACDNACQTFRSLQSSNAYMQIVAGCQSIRIP